MSGSPKAPLSPASSSAANNAPNFSDQSSWPSEFAKKVNADLRVTEPHNTTGSHPHIRVLKNVDGAAHQPRRAGGKRIPPITRRFIAVYLAVLLVTAALVGAMIAIAKTTKDGAKLNHSFSTGSLTSGLSKANAETTSYLTKSGSIQSASSPTTLESTPLDSADAFTHNGSTAYSRSLQVEPSSDSGSSVETTHVIPTDSHAISRDTLPLSSTTSRPNVSYDLPVIPTNAPTNSIDTITNVIWPSTPRTPSQEGPTSSTLRVYGLAVPAWGEPHGPQVLGHHRHQGQNEP